MEGVGDILQWATGTLEGVAFVEYLILAAIFVLWRKSSKHETESEDREAETQKRFAEGSAKMAVLDERTKAMQGDIREIKTAVQSR